MEIFRPACLFGHVCVALSFRAGMEVLRAACRFGHAGMETIERHVFSDMSAWRCLFERACLFGHARVWRFVEGGMSFRTCPGVEVFRAGMSFRTCLGVEVFRAGM